MSFLTSRLAWGEISGFGTVLPTYRFPASFRVVSEDAITMLEASKSPGSDFSHIPAGNLNPKMIAVAGTIGGSGAFDSAGNAILTRDDAEAEAQLLVRKMLATYDSAQPDPVALEKPLQLASMARRFLPLQIGDADGRFTWVELSKFATSFVEGIGEALIEVELEFYAPDPRWLAASPTVVDLTHLTPPYSTVWAIGGNARTYPRYQFAWTNQSGGYPSAIAAGVIGPDGKVVRLNLPIAGFVGTVTINCDPRERDVAIMVANDPRLDYFGDTTSSPSRVRNDYGDPDFLPFLVPGNNTITVDGFGNGAGNDSYVVWREAWIL